jgi:Holliday junction DNA helicase RuvB
VGRLKALVDIAKRRGDTLGHVLLIGADGYGKRTIAHTVTRELGVNVRETSGAAIERVGDLAAIINDLDEGDVLLILNINRIRSFLVDILAPALRTFVLDIIVGKGAGARNMKLSVKPFTLIGTALKEANCPRDLLNCFDVVLSLQRYREPEMLQLTENFAKQIGISVEPGAVALVAKLADGNPSTAESLARRLRLVDTQPITEAKAREMLSVFRYGGRPAAVLVGGRDLAGLSGIEFEHLITAAVKEHGLLC